MKRYYVFAGEAHYPGGGSSDFVSFHDTLYEAMKKEGHDWGHITNENMVMVVFWDRPASADGFRDYQAERGWCVEDPTATTRHKARYADREWAIRFDVPLSSDAPKEVVIDWLLEHGREEAAEYLRGT